MNHTATARTASRQARQAHWFPRAMAACLLLLLLLLLATLTAASGHGLLASSFPHDVSPVGVLRDAWRGGPGEADGVVPDGATVLDDETPAVANLDPDLRAALRRAATAAALEGVELLVNSGWRSTKYQEQLLDDAVSQRGSRAEAARWVATTETSPHVSGDAVDIGHADGAAWLSAHGAALGLCRIYGNEPWHFELRPEAVEHGCPGMYADPTQDPRMQP